MKRLPGLEPERVFQLFEEICAVPHGSENMERIAAYCLDFARERGLKAVSDAANNVVIYQPATPGYEAVEPIILQGHLDMVCQKEADLAFDFEKDGIRLIVDGDRITADGTTLGADNGIAVAMILAILDGDATKHPAIEAVFTTDEEIGMLGADRLDMNLLSANRMINLDAEEESTLTVSCAGGSDFSAEFPLLRQECEGTVITVRLEGLQGGHSGVEIDKGRVNASVLAGRVLHQMRESTAFDLLEITGGDKSNAIPPLSELKLVAKSTADICTAAEVILSGIQREIAAREPSFSYSVQVGEYGRFSVLTESERDGLIDLLICAPNGIQEMSASISGLVETSLNLGILKTTKDAICFQYALRSNLQSALEFLQQKMLRFFKQAGCRAEIGGAYPPWEFRADSPLQATYQRLYQEEFGHPVQVVAIHAGLECGLFSAKIPNLDCIAIGPDLFDVHTTKEQMSISSVGAIYRLLLRLLAEVK